MPRTKAATATKKRENLTITRGQKGGAYDDVLDFLNTRVAEHGSVACAAANVIRRSRDFKAWANGRNGDRQ